MKKVILLTIWTLVSLGCAKKNSDHNLKGDFTALFGGVPYKGTVSGSVSIDGGRALDFSGVGTIALIEATEDSVSIVLLSDVDDLGEINIKVRGKIDDKSFYMDGGGPASYFKITDQIVDGQFNSETQELNFDGVLKRERGQISMVAIFKEETENFPKGTRLELHFDTHRDMSESNGDVSGCPLKLVPVWSPSGVTMGMVPDC